MPTSSRRARISVVEQLLDSPRDYTFIQVIRLLERAAVFEAQDAAEKTLRATSPVATFSPPTKEIVQFKSSHSLRFPSTEISKIELKTNDSRARYWQVMVNFIGVTGAMGVLPFHYTELILQRLKQRDAAMAHFLDLFNHRSISLYFQASTKYRLPLEYERSKLHEGSKTKECMHTQALMSILGLGTPDLRNRQSVRDESLIYYSGLFTQQARTPTALKQLIEDYFDVPCEVEGFIGQWQELIDDVRTRLPWKTNRMGQNVCLGRSCMLGRRGWFAQGKSRIKLGPLNRQQWERFAPGTGALKALNELSTSYLGLEQNFDYVIEVKRDEIPKKVALGTKQPPLLSWNTWLSGRPNTNSSKDELLEIVVSSKKLN